MTDPLFFYIFGGISVVLVMCMIFMHNPVTSALCLVGSFFALAGLYVTLSSPFVAILQVLVYAGAVMVLFVFIIMLLKLRPEDLVEEDFSLTRVVGVALGLSFYYLLVSQIAKTTPSLLTLPAVDFGEAKGVGRLMFTDYLLPFELTSILIMVSLVGVVILGKKEGKK